MKKAEKALLIVKKIIVQAKYFDFINIFPKKYGAKLSKHFTINKDLFDLKIDKHIL